MVGALVAVGFLVGTLFGILVGALVGALVGFFVGPEFGTLVGTLVGIFVGPFGIFVGDLVGTLVVMGGFGVGTKFGCCEPGLVEGDFGVNVGVTIAGLRVTKSEGAEGIPSEGGDGIPSIGGLVLIKGGSVGVAAGPSDVNLVGRIEGTAVVGLAEGSGPTLGEAVP